MKILFLFTLILFNISSFARIPPNDLARIVGADHFVLKVGETLLERSADIGLRADGVPAAENLDEIIKASRRVHEKLDEVDLSKTTVVNLFGSTALTLAGQLEQTPRVLKDIKDVLKSQGKSPEAIDLAQQQAKELMQNPDVADVIETHEAALQEVEQEVQKLAENLKRLEQKHEELAASDVLKAAITEADAFETPLETLQAQLEHMDLSTPEGQSLQYHIAAIDHDQKVNTLSHKLLLKTAETVEKFESFLERNPNLTKTMRYGVEGINGVLMASGVKGLLTSGLPKALVALGFGEALSTASSWAGGKVEGMVAEVATSESEAQRFMKALKTCAGTAGVVVGVKIATKSLKASKIQPPTIKDALSERPIIKDGKVWLGETELGEVAALNKAPYNPRKMEALLKQGGSEVTSSTLPGSSAKNVGLAGQRHPKTGIVFDQRGFPIYDDISKVEVRIKGDLYHMKPGAHKISATKQLRADIEAGKINKKLFSSTELDDIFKNKPKIGEYTWHHHQETGKMQLVPSKIHQQTGHIGGNAIWGMEKK